MQNQHHFTKGTGKQIAEIINCFPVGYFYMGSVIGIVLSYNNVFINDNMN